MSDTGSGVMPDVNSQPPAPDNKSVLQLLGSLVLAAVGLMLVVIGLVSESAPAPWIGVICCAIAFMWKRQAVRKMKMSLVEPDTNTQSDQTVPPVSE